MSLKSGAGRDRSISHDDDDVVREGRGIIAAQRRSLCGPALQVYTAAAAILRAAELLGNEGESEDRLTDRRSQGLRVGLNCF